VPLDDVFSNGMAYPGDPAGGPENTVNCLCTLEYQFDDRIPDSFENAETASEWAQLQYGSWGAARSSDEVASLARYQQRYYRDINGYLRGLRSVDDLRYYSTADEIGAEVGRIADSIGAASAPEDMVVFRYGNLPADIRVGSRFVDDGFVSTSLSRAGYEAGDLHNFRVLVPKGTPAAYVEAAVTPGQVVAFGVTAAEVVLQRGLTYEFLGEIDGMQTVKVVFNG